MLTKHGILKVAARPGFVPAFFWLFFANGLLYKALSLHCAKRFGEL